MNLNYLTSKQVAEILGCTQRNICFLIRDKKISPTITLENGHYLFLKEDIAFVKVRKYKK